MDSYTITIAPNDDSGAATRLVVDTAGDQIRITDVHLHAPLGLSSGHIPTVDFALLLQAVTGTVTTSSQTVVGTTALAAPQDTTPALEAAPPAEPQPTSRAPRRRANKATPKRADKATPKAAATPAKTTARAKTAKTAAAPAKKTASTKTAKSAAAPAKKAATRTPTAQKAPAKRARAATPAARERVYRRTPDDLAAVFEQVETVAGVAEHYQVPRYTAQGWVNRLRASA